MYAILEMIVGRMCSTQWIRAFSRLKPFQAATLCFIATVLLILVFLLR